MRHRARRRLRHQPAEPNVFPREATYDLVSYPQPACLPTRKLLRNWLEKRGATAHPQTPAEGGSELLREWLKVHGVTTHRFALLNGIDPTGLWRVLSGKGRTVTLATAMKIERGTGGEVPAESWV